jgi:7-cyano-7-deazaguanine synthase
MKAIVIFSGGIDSTTILHILKNAGYEIIALTFNYGQKHQKEIEYAKKISNNLGLEHLILELPVLYGSALTEKTRNIPEVEYSIDSQHATVVPNRNMVFIAHAVSVAIANNASEVYYGAHMNDKIAYPDCTIQFVKAVQSAIYTGNYEQVTIKAPFIEMTKDKIIETGTILGVPYAETWSCYTGHELHCGVCGTCRERKNAFKRAGIPDPTNYL